MIEVTAPGKVRLDYGPVQMTIGAQAGCVPLTETAQQAACYAMNVLAELADYHKIAASWQQDIADSNNLPAVLQRMLAAVKRAGDITLTPMAAVAGTIADLTADWLLAQGATKAIVNNGGDIAVRLTGTQTTVVGIAPAIGLKPTHALPLDAGRGIGGIATSGLGGAALPKALLPLLWLRPVRPRWLMPVPPVWAMLPMLSTRRLKWPGLSTLIPIPIFAGTG